MKNREWTVEKSRTAAGYRLWQELSPKIGADAASKQIAERVRVRVVKMWGGDDDKAGIIETSLDGGPWVNECVGEDGQEKGYKLVFMPIED
jgi:hypothetical protein